MFRSYIVAAYRIDLAVWMFVVAGGVCNHPAFCAANQPLRRCASTKPSVTGPSYTRQLMADMTRLMAAEVAYSGPCAIQVSSPRPF
jgi:hypothetical protein